nr:PREDICTED: arginyl-tRNA--protein transferase 1-like [Nicotiana tabacum]
MDEPDFEDSDDELDPESSDVQLPKVENGDVGNVLIGLKEVRLRYKDLREAFGSSERRFMETQLHRYMRAVGTELSERIVYSLG